MSATPKVGAISVRPIGLLPWINWKQVLILVTVLCMAIFCPGVRAQSGAGSIQGTVTDSTGAVIPGASIRVVNNATNVPATAKSSGVGFYQVPGLFVGTYTVTVSAPNMKTYVKTIQLLVSQTAVVNPVMTAGAVTQQVEVTGNTVQLTDTTSGTIGSTLENQRISQIPMNGREVLALTQMTTPGLESLEGQGTRANGLMPEALEYVADGVPLLNRNFGGPNATDRGQFPDPDSIQEVKMDLTDANAQFATPGTAIITTKSGTNQLHGSAFETAVNSYWGTAKNRNQSSTFKELPYIRNEFGASAGGPIVIPHVYHGKDKSFWFFAYERYSLATTTQESVTVPTTAMRGGDFSNLLTIATPVQLYDPSTTYDSGSATCPGTPITASNPTGTNPYCRQPFTNDQIPIGRLNPSAKLLNSITPLPSNSNNPFELGNLSAPNVTFVRVPTITFRLDHSFNETNKAYLRYTSNDQYNRALRNYPSQSPATIAGNGFPDGASGYQIIPDSNFAGAVGYTHVFSPTFFSETILSQQWFMQYVGGGGNPNLNYDKMLGLPNNFGETGFPVISGMHAYQFGGTMFQYQENQIISQIDENLTKTVGKHQMLFGGRYRHERLYYLNSRRADSAGFSNLTTGLYDPSSGKANEGTAAPATGISDADFFLGSAGSYSVQLEPPPSWFRDMEFDAYFQDNYHVSRNLTLNLGLRYEAHPAPHTKYNVTQNFDLKNDALVLGAPISQLIQQGWTTQAIITNMLNIGTKFETPAEAGMPSALIEGANLTVGPRVGIAWQPFGNRFGTVLRGGYGRYIYPIPTRNFNPGPQNLPFMYGYTQNYNAANQSPDGFPNYLLRHPQSIFMGVNAANVVDSTTVTAITPGSGFSVAEPDYKPDQVTEVNATLEQPLRGNSALRVSWVWSHGSYLDQGYFPNNHPSTFLWEVQTGIDPPNGGASVIGTPQQNTYAATATGPYDNTVWGSFNWDEKTGWSNDNELELNYQRLYHNGLAYQIFYVWGRNFRVGGNSTRDGTVYPTQSYFGVMNNANVTVSSPYPITTPPVPPARPSGIASYADWHALNVWERYQLDAGTPPQHIQFNYVYDLPFGRGKQFLSRSNRFLDELIGGYQIAGDGSILNQIFQPNGGYWGPINPIHLYKHGTKINDCRSGTCYSEYMWFNGYIPSTQIAGPNCTNGKCVYGLPADYQPYAEPIDTVPGTSNYNTNNVTVSGGSLKAGGETQGYGSGPVGANPYSKTFIHGPWNWNSDISLYKVFPITERANLRFNMDVFNFLNHQGFTNPNGTDGTERYLAGGNPGASSYNTPRQVQFTLRLSF